ncbi:photosynthetic complex putative assembly protein PuhB [Mesorhizobium loti]|uniref:PH domain-containing protein n=1 Tax=Mesorhizobium loti R88b TaxID=935548 RepID=A0A6M7WT95_RHILI|nr:photosynthetic complex putative assembly protein PuhB [Mesorhizobium loti]QKD05287.1 PH domain-containing protein [Mesorhizobium loti R88b]
MEDHDDYAFEPIPGLPEKLPKGETMLWQGSPEWRPLSFAAFHIRKVAVYFALLLAWDLTSASRAGASLAAMLSHSAWLVGVAGGAIAILCLLAFLYARGTIYTLTTKRIVIRSGLALPVTLNLPLSLIETASVTKAGNGIGSIALTVVKPNRVAWLVLWPNTRPWNISNPQPMLRCLSDADVVAPMLAKALEADAGVAGARPVRTQIAAKGHAPMPAGATIAA